MVSPDWWHFDAWRQKYKNTLLANDCTSSYFISFVVKPYLSSILSIIILYFVHIDIYYDAN
jgi:cytochrome c oxidase assembly factor CtaG